MNDVEKFLLLNGFKKTDNKGIYRGKNKKCRVIIHDDYYEVFYDIENDKTGSMYSTDLNIYWLIGVLTYHGLMDKKYKQFFDNTIQDYNILKL
jgi:hypothetical protein